MRCCRGSRRRYAHRGAAEGEPSTVAFALYRTRVDVYRTEWPNDRLLRLQALRSGTYEERLKTSSFAVSSGKSDGDGEGDDVLSLLKSASSKARDEEDMNSRRRSPLLQLPSPASRRSSIGQNSAPLLPLSPTAHRNSANNILLVPPVMKSRHNSNQLKVPPLS